MPLITKHDRHQIQMFSLEGMIAKDNAVRLIDVFVDLTDMESMGFLIKGKSREGRPAYESQGLLKLFIYGYMNKLRSSRELSRACRLNIELWWLMNYLFPKYRTIGEFRKNNVKALGTLFRAFNVFLRGEGLFSDDTVAIDGSKFRAQNSKKNNYNEKKVTQHLKHINKEIEKHLEQVARLDKEEQIEEEQYIYVATKLDELTTRESKYSDLKNRLKEGRKKGETQISTTDEDARALPKKMNIVEMSYNVQAVTEAKNSLIVEMEVTNKNDTYALSRMAKKGKEMLDVDFLRVLADRGYDVGVELQLCKDQGIETYVAPRKRINTRTFRFTKDKFAYDNDIDSYKCPAGELLKTNGSWYKKNNEQHRKSYQVQHYKLPFKVCNHCKFRDQCIGPSAIKNRQGKYIERSEYQKAIDENIARIRLNKSLYRKRQSIVEHPFGTIKRGWGYSYTLLKTKEKVSGEFALIFTCYNLRRSMSILGVEELINRLKGLVSPFFDKNKQILSLFKAFYCLVKISPSFKAKHKWARKLP